MGERIPLRKIEVCTYRPKTDDRSFPYWVDRATALPPLPGDCWWSKREHGPNYGGCWYWANCQDPRGHVYVMLPDGKLWSPQGRSHNCKLPQDRRHRCWAFHENGGRYTADASGETCGATDGSIYSGAWHGILLDGYLVSLAPPLTS